MRRWRVSSLSTGCCLLSALQRSLLACASPPLQLVANPRRSETLEKSEEVETERSLVLDSDVTSGWIRPECGWTPPQKWHEGSRTRCVPLETPRGEQASFNVPI
eukprot:1591001-Rhodomonas_salina.1